MATMLRHPALISTFRLVVQLEAVSRTWELEATVRPFATPAFDAWARRTGRYGS